MTHVQSQFDVHRVVEYYFPECGFQVLPGGSANLMIAVSTQTCEQVMRLYLENDVARFRTEIRTLQRLASVGAPTPRIRQWGLRCAVLDRPFLIYRMLRGTTLTHIARHVPAGQLTRLVRLTAQTAIAFSRRLPVASHGYLHVHDPAGGARQSMHDIDRYCTVISDDRLLRPAMLDRARVWAADNVALLSTGSPRLVHPDLKPDNVIVDTDAVSLIDWELPVGGHPMLAYGGLLAEGLAVPRLRDALRVHVRELQPRQQRAALTAGLLRTLEALSYLPTNPPYQGGRRVRLDADVLADSIDTMLGWLPA